jgi:hypothetical protein
VKRQAQFEVASPRVDAPKQEQDVLGVYEKVDAVGNATVEYKMLRYFDNEYHTFDVEYGWMWHAKPMLWFALPDVGTVRRILERIEGV